MPTIGMPFGIGVRLGFRSLVPMTHPRLGAPLVLALVFAAQGCATGTDVKRETSIVVVRVPSHTVLITRARVLLIDSRIVLEGELTHRYPVRGPIPGHLHVEVLDANAEVVRTAKFDYPQARENSRTLDFRVSLPGDMPASTAVRLVHHDDQSHLVVDSEPVWTGGAVRDVPRRRDD